MIIGIASGKGGTGKTTVAVNLAWSAPEPALLLDCDVEEPNCHLFFDARIVQREIVGIPVPVLAADKCTACGLCHDICQFHAVAFFGDRPLLFPELCHGCGGCSLVCPEDALREEALEIGAVEVAESGQLTLVQGRLRVGRALSPPLIRAVRRRAEVGRLTIIDGPPGTACPMAAALAGCDVVLLVAEPTRFGLHDLDLAIQSVRQLGVPFGVVINRAGERSDLVRAFCSQQSIEILAEIPEREEVARVISRGCIAAEAFPEVRSTFVDLWSAVLASANSSAAERAMVRHAYL